MRAGCYQFNPAFGKKEDNLQKILFALKDQTLDLLVLPEFFATGYQFASMDEVAELSEPVPEGKTTVLLSELSREKNMYIVAGLPEREGGTFYNSAIITGPEGYMGVYRKTHLFLEEKLYFSPGNTGFRVWDTDRGKVGVMICFDWFFPESMRTLTLMGAEIVAHPSNLVLPYCPTAMPVHCLENRVYAVTANRIGSEERKKGQLLRFIGQSQVASPEGKVLVRAPEDTEFLVVADIEPSLARDKALNPFNNIFNDLRPEWYRDLKKDR